MSKRNSALDSLRGLSTILIVVYHISFVSGYTVAHANSSGAYIDRLNIGVAIFFCSQWISYSPAICPFFDPWFTPAKDPELLPKAGSTYSSWVLVGIIRIGRTRRPNNCEHIWFYQERFYRSFIY